MASVLAQTKGYHGEKVISSFEASRKRLLSPQEEEESARDERERVAHPEKRARIAAGEKNFISHKSRFALITRGLYKSSMTLRSFASVHRPLTRWSKLDRLPAGKRSNCTVDLGPVHLKRFSVWPCFRILATLSQRSMSMKMRQLEAHFQF